MRVRKRAVRYARKKLRTKAERRDPSRTSSVIRAYTADLRRKWREAERLIWETVFVNDALNLRARAAQAAFSFPSDPEGRAREFNAWLDSMLDNHVLEVTRGPGGRIASSSRWQDTYVRAAYGKGTRHAEDAMRRAGIAFPRRTADEFFRTPRAASSLANLYARQFNDLEGITRETSTRIGRVLTEGLATGLGPREMARNMRDQVRGIGMARSLTLARTETIHAHAESTLDRYADAGLEGVRALAEFLSAQDDLVCPQCLALETGEPIDIDKARGLIPVHPNCRCVWLPAIDDGTKKAKPDKGVPLTAAKFSGPSVPGVLDAVTQGAINARLARHLPGVNHEQFMRRMVNVPDDWSVSEFSIQVRGPALQVSARLHDADGSRVGLIERSLHFDKGYAKHQLFKLHETVQGQGVSRRILRSQIDLYRQSPSINAVKLSANITVGGYAWARYGFVPDPDHLDWIPFLVDDVKDKLEVGLTALVAEFGVDQADMVTAALTEMLSGDVHAIRVIAGTPLGKRLLLGTSWFGTLDLADDATMAMFDAYARGR